MRQICQEGQERRLQLVCKTITCTWK